MRWPWQPQPPHACEATARIEAACAELDRQGREGSQYVLIARMITMLDPGNKLVRPPPPPDPRADPLFGTLPVTAPVEDMISCGRCGNVHDSRDACPTGAAPVA